MIEPGKGTGRDSDSGAGTSPRAVGRPDPDPDLFGGSPLRNAATALRRVLGYDAERYGVQTTSIIQLARNMVEDLVEIIDEMERGEEESSDDASAPDDALAALDAELDAVHNGTVSWETIQRNLDSLGYAFGPDRDEGSPPGGDPSLGDAMIEGMKAVNERLEREHALRELARLTQELGDDDLPPPASVARCLGGVKHGEGSFGVPIEE